MADAKKLLHHEKEKEISEVFMNLLMKSKERFKNCFDDIIAKYDNMDDDDEPIDIFSDTPKLICKNKIEPCSDPIIYTMSNEEKQYWRKFKRLKRQIATYRIQVKRKNRRKKKATKSQLNISEDSSILLQSSSREITQAVADTEAEVSSDDSTADCEFAGNTVYENCNQGKEKTYGTASENLNASSTYDSVVHKLADIINMSLVSNLHKRKRRTRRVRTKRKMARDYASSSSFLNDSMYVDQNYDGSEDSSLETTSSLSEKLHNEVCETSLTDCFFSKDVTEKNIVDNGQKIKKSVQRKLTWDKFPLKKSVTRSFETSNVNTSTVLNSIETYFDEEISSSKMPKFVSTLNRRVDSIEFNDLIVSSDDDQDDVKTSLYSLLGNFSQMNVKSFSEQKRNTLSESHGSRFLTLTPTHSPLNVTFDKTERYSEISQLKLGYNKKSKSMQLIDNVLHTKESRNDKYSFRKKVFSERKKVRSLSRSQKSFLTLTPNTSNVINFHHASPKSEIINNVKSKLIKTVDYIHLNESVTVSSCNSNFIVSQNELSADNAKISAYSDSNIKDVISSDDHQNESNLPTQTDLLNKKNHSVSNVIFNGSVNRIDSLDNFSSDDDDDNYCNNFYNKCIVRTGNESPNDIFPTKTNLSDIFKKSPGKNLKPVNTRFFITLK